VADTFRRRIPFFYLIYNIYNRYIYYIKAAGKQTAGSRQVVCYGVENGSRQSVESVPFGRLVGKEKKHFFFPPVALLFFQKDIRGNRDKEKGGNLTFAAPSAPQLTNKTKIKYCGFYFLLFRGFFSFFRGIPFGRSVGDSFAGILLRSPFGVKKYEGRQGQRKRGA